MSGEMPNLFDASTRSQMADLYGKPKKPSPEKYKAHLHEWLDLADKRHTPAEMAVIAAYQARRIRNMGNK